MRGTLGLSCLPRPARGTHPTQSLGHPRHSALLFPTPKLPAWALVPC